MQPEPNPAMSDLKVPTYNCKRWLAGHEHPIVSRAGSYITAKV
jgi:hypothetical protein